MSGDCTFEVDECGWSNVGTRDRLDDLDWDRISGQATRTPTHDHTLGTEKGKPQAQVKSECIQHISDKSPSLGQLVFIILDIVMYIINKGDCDSVYGSHKTL